MSFRFSKGIALLSTIVWSLFSSFTVYAQDEIKITTAPQSTENDKKVETNTLHVDTGFIAQPANCITLHQGRTCYATVTFSWVLPKQQSVCIYQKQAKKLLKCWKNSRKSQWFYEFESKTKVEFQLLNLETNQLLSETAIDVSWVHKATPRKRRWRVF